jgi:hypothetical protein
MRRRPHIPLGIAAISIAGLGALIVGCGASINAVYEGDVRFEHCMALDSRPDVKPTLRRACWEEWMKFYTFGQTRDRVDYALLRRNQLNGASDFDEGEWAPSRSRVLLASPEPTSALAPPPAMLSTGAKDAGAPAEAPSSQASRDVDRAPPSSECVGECDDSWGLCRQDCRSPACEKACTGKYKRCMRKCF